MKELAAYCRRKGLYVEQIGVGGSRPIPVRAVMAIYRWKTAGRYSRTPEEPQAGEGAQAQGEGSQAAALLVLQKKARAIWGDAEED